MVKRIILVSTIIMTVFSLSYFGNNIYVLSKSIEDKNNNYIVPYLHEKGEVFGCNLLTSSL